MLYSEFINGTGCKQNDYNYKVFTDLEILYMNSELTKEEIYEYGKKLVDNSKSAEEIETENRIKDEIEFYKETIARNKEYMRAYRESAEFWKAENDMELYRSNYNLYKMYRDENKIHRATIKKLKSLLVA